MTILVLLAARLASAAAEGEKPGPKPLGLDALLQAAVAHDGRVLAAHAQLDAYRAKYDQASWMWFPAAKLQVLFGFPVGERRLDCPDDPNCVRLKDATPWSFGNLEGDLSFAVGGKLEAVMPLYTFGKLDGAEDAAAAGVRGGEAGISKARQDVAMEVRRAYYGWLLATTTVDILADGSGKLEDAEKKLLKMLDAFNENVTDRDLFKLRYNRHRVESMLIQARQGRKVALAALRFLTGIEGLGDERPLQKMELEAEIDELEEPEAYLEQARRLRPELRQLHAAVEAANAAVEIRKASFYPDLFVAGSIAGSYSPAHDLIENSLLNRGYTYYDAGLSLGLRLTLDIPQKIARLDQSRADVRRLQTLRDQAVRAAGLQIEKKIEQLTAARDNLKALRRARRSAKSWMRANWMSYGVGLSNTKDLLDSLAAYAMARMELYKAQHDTLILLDGLRAAVGENLARAR